MQPNQQMSSIKAAGPAGGTRGSSHRLNRQFTNCMQRKNFFTNRVVPNWNRLPNELVSALSVNQFKNKYDRYIEEISNKKRSTITGFCALPCFMVE